MPGSRVLLAPVACRRLTVARTSSNVVWYADDVQKEKKRRRLIRISCRLHVGLWVVWVSSGACRKTNCLATYLVALFLLVSGTRYGQSMPDVRRSLRRFGFKKCGCEHSCDCFPTGRRLSRGPA